MEEKIVEDRVAQEEDYQFLNKLYQLVDEYHKDHPNISVMMVANNPTNHVGTGFLVGDDGVVAKQMGKLATLYKYPNIQRVWEGIVLDASVFYHENKE